MATKTAKKPVAASVKASPTQVLSEFLASIRYEDLPDPVVARTEDLFLDWFASALAGKGSRPVQVLEQFAAQMGPSDGPCEILTARARTSSFFAALVNGGASHVVEQDDLHNSSVLHPGTVVFPAVLAVAQETGASGKELIAASVAGYEAGVRVGEFLGRSHYQVFHTTGTAGKLAAAAGVARLLKLDADRTQHALGSAGTMAAGLWEFIREGEQGLAAGMSDDADPARLTDRLGTRWALAETSFKFHASCRHTHPAADALLELMRANRLKADNVASVTAHVHQGALDVLGPVTNPQTVHQSKFSMGFVLAMAALHGRAGLADFTDSALQDPKARAFHDKVRMKLDPEIDRAYPKRWMGRVTVKTREGRELEQRITSPKGDPDNTLMRAELEDKALRLAGYAGGAGEAEMKKVIARVWRLRRERDVRDFLGGPGAADVVDDPMAD